MSRTVAIQPILGGQVFRILAEPDEPTRRLVIMAHGFRGDSTGPARTFVEMERHLLEDGIAVLRFDQPGSGNSAGDFLDSSFDTWVEVIAELARIHREAGYAVALLGQSMGAVASLIATSRPSIRDRVPAVILWSPGVNDAAEFPGLEFLTLPFEGASYVEEAGQRVRADYWREASNAGFFAALDAYRGRIHLVFGEHDRFDQFNLRPHTIQRFESNGHEVTILPGQDHSGWSFRAAQEVYALERQFLAKNFPSN